MVAAPHAIDVILRDGSTLRLRPPVSGDAKLLVAFFRDLSPQSLFLRFHGMPALGSRLVEPFLDPDWNEVGSLAGTVAEDGGERIVALASYARLRDPAAAEVAFAVAD
ncbi:MAG: multidrug ABC transporter permease, partial [Actinomycetota bacterium]|nr:multidrug ABC transporter permease [Actinomycetota bacterium]